MSQANSSRFKQELYPPDCSRTIRTSTQLPVAKVPTDRLHNPATHPRPWFSQTAPGQPVSQPAQETLVAWSMHQVAGSHQPSSRAAPNSSIPRAQAASHVPAILCPVSQVMSDAPLPAPALLPSSPWRQTSPHLQPHAAPSISGTSVIIAKDISQPTLAKALGFADSLQQSASMGRQVPAALAQPKVTAPPQCHRTAIDMRAMEVLPQTAAAQSQTEEAGAEGLFTQRAPDGSRGALAQSGLQRLVTQVHPVFADQPAKFDAFLHLVHEHQANHIDNRNFEKQVSALTLSD